MTHGNPIKLMLGFAFPVILTNLGQQFYTIADAAIVGYGAGMEAFEAVGCTDWTYWVILWSVSVMTQGFATFVSRYFGKRDYGMMNKAITMSVVLSLAIAVFFTVIGLVLADPVLTLLKTPVKIHGDALLYLSTMISGTVIVAGYNLTSAILRAFGDGKTPLAAMVMSAALNIVLDLLFVIGFQGGVFGAALASLISQAAAFAFCAFRIFTVECVKLDRKAWEPDWRLLLKLLVFGLPLAIQYIVINVGGMVCQSTVNIQGSEFIAGYTAVSKLYGLFESSAISLGAAFTTFASQNFGAGDHKRVRDGYRKSIILAFGASGIIMSLILPLRGVLPRLFIDTSDVGAAKALEVSAEYLTNMAIFLPILYLIYVYRSNFQAIGDSLWSMVSGFAEAATRIIMVKPMVMYLGTGVLYYVEPFSWLASLVFVMVPYFFCRKKLLSRAASHTECVPASDAG